MVTAKGRKPIMGKPGVKPQETAPAIKETEAQTTHRRAAVIPFHAANGPVRVILPLRTSPVLEE